MRAVGDFRLLIALHDSANWTRGWMVGKCSRGTEIACEGSQEGYGFLPEASHLLQLEQPEQCVAMLRNFLAIQGIL